MKDAAQDFLEEQNAIHQQIAAALRESDYQTALNLLADHGALKVMAVVLVAKELAAIKDKL